MVLAPIAHQQYLLREAGLATDGEKLELWPAAQDEAAADRLLSSLTANAQPRHCATASGRGRHGEAGTSGGTGCRPHRSEIAGATGSARGAPPAAWVGLHPGGSLRWKTKRWDLSRWAKVCDALQRSGARVVVVGGPEEQELGQQLTALTEIPPLVIIGKTRLMELACVIKRCAVFLSHDSSSLHVASAVGTPVVALFGPTDPRRHLPPAFAGQVIRKEVFCSPCYSTRCRTITHACMKRITVDEVLYAAHTLLAEKEPAAP